MTLGDCGTPLCRLAGLGGGIPRNTNRSITSRTRMWTWAAVSVSLPAITLSLTVTLNNDDGSSAPPYRRHFACFPHPLTPFPGHADQVVCFSRLSTLSFVSMMANFALGPEVEHVNFAAVLFCRHRPPLSSSFASFADAFRPPE